MDHYATLGVSPEAAPATIRAAYLDLVRQYHPDRNRSSAAAAQMLAITAAYSALRTPEGRASYDLERQRRRLTHLSWSTPSSPMPRAAPRKSAWLPPLVGIAAVLLLVPMLFDPSVPEQKPTFVGGAGGQKRNAQRGQSEEDTVVRTADCSSPGVSNVVKRALFDGALRLRPDARTQLESLVGRSRILTAGAAPAAGVPTSGAVQCEAVIAIDLPPGLATWEGGRTIEGTISYVLKFASQGSGGTVGLTSVGSLPATLSRIKSTATHAETVVAHVSVDRTINEGAAYNVSIPYQRPAALPRQVALPRPAPPLPRLMKQAYQTPSFSCHSARTQSARLVCNSAFLAALDRDMARLYGSVAAASPSAVPLLRRTESRFLARRDACSTEACIVNGYFAVIREIQDISAVSGGSSEQLGNKSP